MKLHDRLYFSLALAFVLLTITAGTLTRLGYDILPDRSLCMSQLLLGRDCPGCGMTRSLVSLGAGSLSHALAFNSLGPFLFLCALLQVILRAPKLAGKSMPWLFEVDLGMLTVIVAVVLAHTFVFYFV